MTSNDMIMKTKQWESTKAGSRYTHKLKTTMGGKGRMLRHFVLILAALAFVHADFGHFAGYTYK
jgi:hypothetical protein